MPEPSRDLPRPGRIDDPARLEAVRRSGLSATSEGFVRYTRMASAALRVPVVLFSVVDDHQQVFPAQAGLAEPWASRGATPLELSYCRYVVEGDDVVVVDDAAHDPWASSHPANDQLGVTAYAGVPVRDRDGQVLGAFCAIDHEPRTWTSDELLTLRDLADSVESELALREASDELHLRLAREGEELRFEQRLAAVASAANRADGIRAVAEALLAHGEQVVGASTISMALVEADSVELHHSPGVHRDVAEIWRSTDRTTRVPLVVSAVEQRPIILPDPDALAAWPALAASVATLGLASLACLPLADRSIGLQAAVALGWRAPLAGGQLPPATGRLTAFTAQALARALRFDREMAQARTLERLVIPSALPQTRGVTVSGTYLAPSTRQRVGGDLYDAVARDDGAVGVVIADAVGHDLEATRAAARVRHAVGVLTVERAEPAALLQSVNSYLLQASRSRLVTCAYLLFDPASSVVRVANAGHPQPRLVRAGSVRRLGPLGDPLLGLAPQVYSEAEVKLEPGDVVVCFTDGLIDRRQLPITGGELWLDRLLGELAGEPAETIGKALLAEVPSEQREDDIALIVTGFQGMDAPGDPPVVELTWPAHDVVLAEARRALGTWLDHQGRSTLHDAASLIVTELLTNARDASPRGGRIRLQARLDRGEVLLAVENAGEVFDPDRAMPSPSSERGRGLALVRHLSRSLALRVTDDGVRVEARLADPGPSPA